MPIVFATLNVYVKTYSISLPASINTSIVQGSGIRAMLYAIMESGLHTISYEYVD